MIAGFVFRGGLVSFLFINSMGKGHAAERMKFLKRSWPAAEGWSPAITHLFNNLIPPQLPQENNNFLHSFQQFFLFWIAEWRESLFVFLWLAAQRWALLGAPFSSSIPLAFICFINFILQLISTNSLHSIDFTSLLLIVACFLGFVCSSWRSPWLAHQPITHQSSKSQSKPASLTPSINQLLIYWRARSPSSSTIY